MTRWPWENRKGSFASLGTSLICSPSTSAHWLLVYRSRV